MKIYTHNFNHQSNSGPNKFSRQLFRKMNEKFKIKIVDNPDNSDVEFCLIMQSQDKVKPRLTRLDGIYFNLAQDFDRLNSPIRYTYDYSDAVIFQSEFDKKLIESWFFNHHNGHVIHNGADVELINSVKVKYNSSNFANFLKNIRPDVEIWSCASSWRPHKRLKENIDYFVKMSPEKSILIIAGKGMQKQDLGSHEKLFGQRIFYVNELDYVDLLCLYKKSKYFLHLAYLDHCPNVVVDAQACGCEIICSSSGGTKEIVTKGIMIKEEEWDFQPIKLYEPPVMNFDNKILIDKNLLYTLDNAVNSYHSVLTNIKE